jgi:hypothetical protein
MSIREINFNSPFPTEGRTSWHEITTPDFPCVFKLLSVSPSSVIEIKSTRVGISTGRSTISFSFLDAASSVISSGETFNPLSTNDFFSATALVPSNAVYLSVRGAQDVAFSVTSHSGKFFAEMPAPTLYTNSQSITINSQSIVTLLGGGAGGGNTGASGVAGGGASGRITNAIVNAGTYTLTIGAGGNAGSTGGTTSFAGFNAIGGNTGGIGFGGSGGSNGGFGGGTNGNTRPGENGNPGSGVSPVLFTGEIAPATFTFAGGGRYCGGSSGYSSANGTPNGGNGLAANGLGGGGMGGSSTNNNVNGLGGPGGAGALWVLPV